MAAVAMILGGMAGLISALIALVLFNASWLLAIGLWCLAGTCVFGLMIALSVTSRRPRRRLQAKHV